MLLHCLSSNLPPPAVTPPPFRPFLPAPIRFGVASGRTRSQPRAHSTTGRMQPHRMIAHQAQGPILFLAEAQVFPSDLAGSLYPARFVRRGRAGTPRRSPARCLDTSSRLGEPFGAGVSQATPRQLGV